MHIRQQVVCERHLVMVAKCSAHHGAACIVWFSYAGQGTLTSKDGSSYVGAFAHDEIMVRAPEGRDVMVRAQQCKEGMVRAREGKDVMVWT